jgi:hypothetical protein
MYDIEEIKPLCTDENILLTAHVLNRMKKRGIQYSDMVYAIRNGEIIEQYENDTPCPSCLVLGYTPSNSPLHTVLSVDGETIWIITAYYPSSDKWDDLFKNRKAVK